MNKFLTNLNRLEFLVTYDCTGKCKHCSVGNDMPSGMYLDKNLAKKIVYDVISIYKIESVMTFGGEPLLNSECVCEIHSAAKEVNVSKRQLITNGFFTKDVKKIKSVVGRLATSGVNDILLSVDAFHQATIPIDTVKSFASEVLKCNLPIRVSPAWLVSKNHINPYNNLTMKIVEEFSQLGVQEATGNIVFPEGNAKKYLSEYFKDGQYVNPYVEDSENLKTISIEPDGTLFGKSLHNESVVKIIEEYRP